MDAATANSENASIRVRNVERVFFLALPLFARLIFYNYGLPGASPRFTSSVERLPSPLNAIGIGLLVVLATLVTVLPGLWFSEQIKLAPSPLLRKWLTGQPIPRRDLTRLGWMVPVGWGLLFMGAVGGLAPTAFGVAVPKPSGDAAATLSILINASPLGIASIAFANAVFEECFLHLTLLTALAWVISRFWRAPDGAPTAGAMWLAIALQAPIASALNLQGRQHGLRLVLDAHTAYGVILGWLYWRHGFEASLIATWSLVASGGGLAALGTWLGKHHNNPENSTAGKSLEFVVARAGHASLQPRWISVRAWCRSQSLQFDQPSHRATRFFASW